jgi:quinol monooxygenase YgiN
MIIVTGSILARNDSFDEILRISTEHVLRSRAEPGCISHAVFRDTEEPLRLQFVERWTDIDALKVHFGVPASRNFAKEAASLADEPPTLRAYSANELPLG